MLAGALGIEPQQAFEALRSYARQRGLRIHDLAHEVVERRVPPSAFAPERFQEAAE
jgi:AmiR/NasT family two-component response regulator